jgi:hypothetical protein
LKVTEPVGIPAADETVAVNVIGDPKLEGLSDEPTAVVVAAKLTVCVNTGEVLGVKIPPPP